MTYFSAGLQVYDIKDPHLPVETGWFVTPEPTKRRGPQPHTRSCNRPRTCWFDTRGNIYVDDKPWGLWIVRYTGPDQPAAAR